MTAPLFESLSLTRGDDFGATFTFDQAVAGFSEMRFTVREMWATDETDNTDAALSVTLSASGTYTADLALTSAQTLSLALDEYVYDLQITTTSGGKKYTTQRGTLHMTPDVTR
jgi:hypothetical protein